jgi:hypothetical protein
VIREKRAQAIVADAENADRGGCSGRDPRSELTGKSAENEIRRERIRGVRKW